MFGKQYIYIYILHLVDEKLNLKSQIIKGKFFVLKNQDYFKLKQKSKLKKHRIDPLEMTKIPSVCSI